MSHSLKLKKKEECINKNKGTPVFALSPACIPLLGPPVGPPVPTPGPMDPDPNPPAIKNPKSALLL